MNCPVSPNDDAKPEPDRSVPRRTPRRGIERQACNRCHGQKLRCTRDTTDAHSTCQRCHRLGIVCVYSGMTPEYTRRQSTSSSSAPDQPRHGELKCQHPQPGGTFSVATTVSVPTDSNTRPAQPTGLSLSAENALWGSINTGSGFGACIASTTTSRDLGTGGLDAGGLDTNELNFLNQLARDDILPCLQLTPSTDGLDQLLSETHSQQSSRETNPMADNFSSLLLDMGLSHSQPRTTASAGVAVSLSLIGQHAGNNDAQRMHDLLQLNLNLHQVAVVIASDISVAAKARSLVPPSQALTAALHGLSVSWQRRSHFATTTGSAFLPSSWNSFTLALTVVLCYNRLLLIMSSFVELLEQRRAHSPSTSSANLGYLSVATNLSGLAPLSHSELDEILQSRLVTHLLDRVGCSVRASVDLYIEGGGAAENSLDCSSMGQHLRVILAKLTEKEQALLTILASLQHPHST